MPSFSPPSQCVTFALISARSAACGRLLLAAQSCGTPSQPCRPSCHLVLPQAVYSFWQYELCDVFIELIKPIIYQDDAGVYCLQPGCTGVGL